MSDNATSVPAAQPIPAAEEDAAGGKKANHVLETPADSPDPDEAEYQAALKEVADEEAAAGTAPVVPAEAPTTPVATPEPTPAAPQAPAVPVAALQEERHKRQQAEERAAYYKGVAEGRFPSPATVREAPAPQAAPQAGDDRKKEIRSELSSLADQVDKGTLTMKEYEEKRGALEDEIDTIRESRIVAKAKDTGGDLYLDQVTRQLESDNQWLAGVPSAELQDLVPGAIRAMVAKGVKYDAIAETPIGDYELRKAVIERAKEFGFAERYKTAAPAAPAAPTTPAAPTAVPTAAQLKEKENLAAYAPPAPAGTSAPASGWNSERVESMDSLDLENMPLHKLEEIGSALDREATATRVSVPTRR